MEPDKYLTQIFKDNLSTTLTTLSPNGNFYFKIQNPSDLYWGLFCCRIAFYDINDNLIYHNSNFYAMCGLDPDREWWTPISYSKSGNYAFFIERNGTRTYFNLLLDLVKKKMYRKEYTEVKADELLLVKQMCKANFDDLIADTIGLEKFVDIVADKLKFELKNLLGLTSWRPKTER